MNKKIAVLPGDGIGEEIISSALNVLSIIAEKYDHSFTISYGDIGGSAYDKQGVHFPESTKRLCQSSDAILLGAVGGPADSRELDKWKNCEKNSILVLRHLLNLNINIRPIVMDPKLLDLCPLQKKVLTQPVDIMMIRELTGDIYFGEHKQFMRQGKRYAIDVAEYHDEQIRTVAHCAFQLAETRSHQLVSVDKANVLETSKLWRSIVEEVAREYPSVSLSHMLVDNCAMQLMLNPCQFDVILTTNMFGDILSDVAAGIMGGLGLAPSASLGTQIALYEPMGGSAPDIARQNKANPIAQILSVALMLDYSFGLSNESTTIKDAINYVLVNDLRTQDIYTKGKQLVSTSEMTTAISDAIQTIQ